MLCHVYIKRAIFACNISPLPHESNFSQCCPSPTKMLEVILIYAPYVFKKLNFISQYSDPLVKFIEFLIFLRGKHNMYIVVTEAIDNGPSLLNTVFDYLSGPSVVIPVLIIMT